MASAQQQSGRVKRIAILMGVREGDPEGIGRYAALVAGLKERGKATQTIPIIFNLTADPVGLGYIESMSRPGGNLTGFIFFEPPLIGKWFELLKQVSPGVAQTSYCSIPAPPAFT
jgi:putative tryptophan/tyrosine transport system substrate-binding protein